MLHHTVSKHLASGLACAFACTLQALQPAMAGDTAESGLQIQQKTTETCRFDFDLAATPLEIAKQIPGTVSITGEAFAEIEATTKNNLGKGEEN